MTPETRLNNWQNSNSNVKRLEKDISLCFVLKFIRWFRLVLFENLKNLELPISKSVLKAAEGVTDIF